MAQLHKRFSDEQVIFLLQAYEQALMSRDEVQDALDISRSRFFILWREYREDPEAFTISYQRTTPRRISPAAEEAIEHELMREKGLIEDPEIPISGYNYSAIRDRLRKQGIDVSVNTIIDRAKKLDCHKPRKKKKAHDREVLTESVGYQSIFCGPENAGSQIVGDSCVQMQESLDSIMSLITEEPLGYVALGLMVTFSLLGLVVTFIYQEKERGR